MSQLHTIRKKVGRYTVNGTAGFSFNEDFEIPLAILPHHMQQGVGHLVELEMVLEGTFSTATGSAKIKSSDLHGWLDWKVYGPEDFLLTNRKGWHDPIRGAFKFGMVEGKRSADIAANASGNRVTTDISFTKHFSLLEENMGNLSRFGRLIPSIAMAKKGGRIIVNANGEDTEVRPATASATGKWDALTITVWAHILDLPASSCVMPILVEEAAANSLTELNPTPGNGMYLRSMIVNSPFKATTEDDVGGYETIDSYGTEGNFARLNEEVDVIKRDFHAELTDALEMHRHTDAVATNQKREYRMLDEHENDDGVNRGIMLTYPRPGQEFSDSRRWYGTPPTLKANNDSRNGLPTSIDILYDRIVPREPKHVTAIQDSLGARARTQAPTMNAGWRGRPGVEMQRIPLVQDGRQ